MKIKLKLILITAVFIFISVNLQAYTVQVDPSSPLTEYVSLGEWNTDNNFDGWDYNDDWTDLHVSDGSLKGTAIGNDPVLAAVTPSFNVQAGTVFELRIKIEKEGGPQSTITETFLRIGGGDNIVPGLRFVENNTPSDNQFHIYRLTLDSDDIAYFGNLTSIRLDPINANGDSCNIDYFRVAASAPAPPSEDPIQKLSVSSNGRFLKKEDGTPFLPIADTAWHIEWKLNRADVLSYLQTRKDQKYNAIGLVAFPDEGPEANVYGDQPFEVVGGKYDPLQPITTSGNDPNNPTEYDYWDHLDFIISSAQDKGLYVIMLPAWGSCIAGSWSDGTPNADVILDVNNASNYACWISSRYQNYTNIIWMLGGDRSAVYGSYDYRPAFRKMADGVLAGNPNRPLLMSFHPRKWKPNSSEWFHNDSWLSFNSCQDQPSDQINSIRHDYALSPVKPTWLFEGGYEERTCSAGTYGSWQVRFQAYQTIFAGAFGYTYGHMSIWDFSSDWKTKVNATGANDMRHLYSLMTSITNSQFFDLIPDQAILDGDTGSMTGVEGFFSSCIVAMRTSVGDLAMIYCANGKNIQVKMDQLAAPRKRARWFDPRSGSYTLISTNVTSGSGASIITFDPPGSEANGNDYVLVLDEGEGGDEPGPDPDPGTGTTAYWRFEEGTAGIAHSGHDDNWYIDSSGDSNYLSAWGDEVNPTAASDVPFSYVSQTLESNTLALSFTGTECISTATESPLNTYTFPNGFTVECMVKYNDFAFGVAVCKEGKPTAVGDPNFCLKRRGNGINELQFQFFDGVGTRHDLRSNITPNTGIWYRVAAVCNGSDAILYMKEPDGNYEIVAEENGTVSGSALYDNEAKWVVGRGAWSGVSDNYLNGYVDEVRITNVALNASQFLDSVPEPSLLIGIIALIGLFIRK